MALFNSYQDYLAQHNASSDALNKAAQSAGYYFDPQSRTFKTDRSYVRPDSQTDISNITAEAAAKAAVEAAIKKNQPADTSSLNHVVNKKTGQPAQPGITNDELQNGDYYLPPSLSDGQSSAIAGAKNVLGAIAHVDQYLKNSKVDTGRSQGTKQFLRKHFGTNLPGLAQTDDEQQLNSLLTAISASYLQSISGKQVSDKERERLNDLLPVITDTRQEISNKLLELKKLATDNITNTIQAATNPTATANSVNGAAESAKQKYGVSY